MLRGSSQRKGSEIHKGAKIWLARVLGTTNEVAGNVYKLPVSHPVSPAVPTTVPVFK